LLVSAGIFTGIFTEENSLECVMTTTTSFKTVPVVEHSKTGLAGSYDEMFDVIRNMLIY
jgi:hypothetical protein